jgi:hypothetical protein
VAEAEQDRLVFVMTVGDRWFQKSVPAGDGRGELERLMGHDRRWIEVDDSQWINQDHVLYAYLSPAGEESGPMVGAV